MNTILTEVAFVVAGVGATEAAPDVVTAACAAAAFFAASSSPFFFASSKTERYTQHVTINLKPPTKNENVLFLPSHVP